jgi:hypothetical protein
MRWYLPGFPDLGTRDKGEDWKCPISSSSSVHEKGPMYLPLLNSVSINKVSIDTLLRGVKVFDKVGIPVKAPCLIYSGMVGYIQ